MGRLHDRLTTRTYHLPRRANSVKLQVHTIVHRRAPFQEFRSEHCGSHLELQARTTLFLSRARLLIESASSASRRIRDPLRRSLSPGVLFRSYWLHLASTHSILDAFFFIVRTAVPRWREFADIRASRRAHPACSIHLLISPASSRWRGNVLMKREAAQLPRELGSPWESLYARTNVAYEQTSLN